MKDNFSHNSREYAYYRPHYPDALRQYFETLTGNLERAWDCGTGSGQMAAELTHFVKRVDATDISSGQLDQAVQKQNIFYHQTLAEKTDFPDSCFDLVTVAQAVHWFNFDQFYQEVYRVLKSSGVFAVIGYGLVRSDPATNLIIDDLYYDILQGFWDPERQYLEENYRTIPFPFEELPAPDLLIQEQWPVERLLGYLGTWSAVSHFRKTRNEDPLGPIATQLRRTFGASRRIRFPLLLRIGRRWNAGGEE